MWMWIISIGGAIGHLLLQDYTWDKWIWIILAAGFIGAIIAYCRSRKIKEALKSALTGGCFAGSCLLQILISLIGILFTIWLLGKIFT